MNLLKLTYSAFLKKFKEKFNKGDYHGRVIYRQFFKEGKLSLINHDNFAKSGTLAQEVEKIITTPKFNIVASKESKSQDGVIKFVLELEDKEVIESVIIPSSGRTTLCISSQVGCRMGCKFCSTAKLGFIRDLSIDEITLQVWVAKFHYNQTIDNIVFMGMGEPLDNFDSVIDAIRVIETTHGFDIPQSKITISTSGDINALNKFSKTELTNIKLAISLNATTDETRSNLMPINRKYPLEMLRETLMNYPLKRKHSFLIEYVLLRDINDSLEDAERIVQFTKGISVKINLIPFNGSDFKAPTQKRLDEFFNYLLKSGLFVMTRESKGDDISAACGQLSGKIRKEKI